MTKEEWAKAENALSTIYGHVNLKIDGYNVSVGLVKETATMSAYGMGGNNTPLVMTETSVVRRLTPLECCRLQGFPDWWCEDIPHRDRGEYRMWGNGVALPCVLYVMEGVRDALVKKSAQVNKKGENQ